MRVSVLLLSALLGLGVPMCALDHAGAQQPIVPRTDRPVRTGPATGARVEIDRTIMIANQLVAQGRVTQAITVLEQLHARNPGEPRIVIALANAYARGGEPLKAVGMLEQQIERYGVRSPELWIHLAAAYRMAGQGGDAVEVMLAALRLKPDWLPRLQDQMELVVTDSLAGPAGLERLRQRSAEPDAPTAWREALAHVLVVTGQFPEAVELVARIDREKEQGGRGLFHLARTVARRGDPEVALAAFDSVLAHAPHPGIAEEVWFERAGLLETLDRPAEALEAYETLVREHPRGSLLLQARLRAAELRRGPLEDLAGARRAYEEILALAPAQSRSKQLRAVREEALLALGECALQGGDFAEAESTLALLERDAVRTSIQEQAAFERAELFFYSGRFAEAEEAYYQLTDHYPAGEWVNDALARALLIGEFAMTAGLALEAYAAVQYQERIGALPEALRLCRTALEDTVNTDMRAHLRYEEMVLAARMQEWAQADSALARLLEQDARSRVAPAALFWMADTSAAIDGRRQRALELLEQLILGYPDSREARRARALLPDLREQADHS